MQNKQGDIENQNMGNSETQEFANEEQDQQDVNASSNADNQGEESVETLKKKLEEMKTKFSASSREAHRLREMNIKLQEDKENLLNKEVTEQELISKYPDWDDKTAGEKEAIRDKENLAIKVKNLEIKNSAFLNEKLLNKQISDSLDLWEGEGKYPQVLEHKAEFIKFCKQKDNKGVEIEKLAKLFSYDLPPTKNKLSTSPIGTSNKRGVTNNSSGLSLDKIATIRRTNPREYQRLISEGKIGTID